MIPITQARQLNPSINPSKENPSNRSVVVKEIETKNRKGKEGTKLQQISFAIASTSHCI